MDGLTAVLNPTRMSQLVIGFSTMLATWPAAFLVWFLSSLGMRELEIIGGDVAAGLLLGVGLAVAAGAIAMLAAWVVCYRLPSEAYALPGWVVGYVLALLGVAVVGSVGLLLIGQAPAPYLEDASASHQLAAILSDGFPFIITFLWVLVIVTGALIRATEPQNRRLERRLQMTGGIVVFSLCILPIALVGLLPR